MVASIQKAIIVYHLSNESNEVATELLNQQSNQFKPNCISKLDIITTITTFPNRCWLVAFSLISSYWLLLRLFLVGFCMKLTVVFKFHQSTRVACHSVKPYWTCDRIQVCLII